MLKYTHAKLLKLELLLDMDRLTGDVEQFVHRMSFYCETDIIKTAEAERIKSLYGNLKKFMPPPGPSKRQVRITPEPPIVSVSINIDDDTPSAFVDQMLLEAKHRSEME